MFNCIKNFFAKEKQIDSKPFRKIMNGFFYTHEWKHQHSITKVEAYQSKNGDIRLLIETHKPGILIGQGGSFIDALTEELNKSFMKKQNIKIDLKECKLWHNLYS